MNSILFSSIAFGFLFCLAEERVSPRQILEDTFRIFACVAVIALTAVLLPNFISFSREDFALWMIPAVFAVCSLARRPVVFFLAVCGLSFRYLSPVAGSQFLKEILQSALLFSGFRMIMLGFNERALFFRPPKITAGLPLKLLQAFWASLILSAWALLPYLRA